MQLNIALIGYGKMGKEIEVIALERGHSITGKFTSSNLPTGESLKGTDVAIEFTEPNSAIKNIQICVKNNIPIVVGTTGWYNRLEEITQQVKEKNGALLWGSNFSIGVNIFFELNKQLAKIMNGFEDYAVRVEETHHIQKKDAPSGTAITIAEGILGEVNDLQQWNLGDTEGENSLPIMAHREKDVPGTHEVYYTSSIDEIEIRHTAFNRKGFALGAVLAAEFLKDKKGVYTPKDLLKLTS